MQETEDMINATHLYTGSVGVTQIVCIVPALDLHLRSEHISE